MEILLLSVVGGILALDQTSLGQFMLARPLVAASIAGGIVGAPGIGLAVGVILEVFFLPAFPVGGARFPEGGPAGVVAAVAAAAAGGGAAGVAIGVAFGAAWGLLGGWSIQSIRRLNDRFVPAAERTSVAPGRITAGHLSALGVDFFRGSVLTAVGIAFAGAAAPSAAALWTPGLERTLVVLGAVAAVSLGGLATGLGGWTKGRGSLAGGAILGALLGWLT